MRWLAVPLLFLPILASAAGSLPVSTNDTFLGRQWYLDSIGARDAWNVTTGTRDVVVAIIDSGVDIDHEDLRGNIWTNPDEIPGNGKDDDGDGYVDDIHGWNFVTNQPDVRPLSSRTGSEEAWLHGTAVASVIAATGNNDIGIAGVAWRARLMPLVVLDADGIGRDQDLIAAIRYAVAHGADIINFSLFGSEYDARLAATIREATASGVLVVSAAGNSDGDGGDNLDAVPGYPACDAGVRDFGKISVTALDRDRHKANKANYGSCVDVSAPGTDLFAARPPRDARTSAPAAGYVGQLTGTSIAAPIVTGLAALLKSIHPSWRGPELARRIIDTSVSVDADNPNYRGALGSGEVNAANALASDARAERLGPITLEASSVGSSPEVRVLSATGTELERFSVGEPGERRGVRATFIRWQGNLEPDIAVTTIGDASGAWRVYRPDGLLIAAGSVGSITGGLTLAAEDLNLSGRDTLFLGEAAGRRAWLVTPDNQTLKEFEPFPQRDVVGIAALALSRPLPALVLMNLGGDAHVSIVGKGGEQLDVGLTVKNTTKTGWTIRRGARPGDSPVFQATNAARSVTYVGDATGVHEVKTAPRETTWIETPLGERHDGWTRYDTWPR